MSHIKDFISILWRRHYTIMILNIEDSPSGFYVVHTFFKWWFQFNSKCRDKLYCSAMYLYCINFVPWVSQFVHLQSCPKKPESQYPPLWPRAIQLTTQAVSPRWHLEIGNPLKIITMRTEQSSSKTPGLTSWFSRHLVGPGQCWWTPTTPTSTRGSRFWGTFREFFRLNWNKLAWEFENLPDWGITLLEV